VGCNRLCTREDALAFRHAQRIWGAIDAETFTECRRRWEEERLRLTVSKRNPRHKDTIAALTAYSGNISTLAEKLGNRLRDPSNSDHAVVVEQLMRNIAPADVVLPEEFKTRLPRALATVAERCPSVVNLVRPLLLKFDTWNDTRLRSRIESTGFAFGMLGTAALIDATQATNGSKPSNGDRRLRIDSTDSLDLGFPRNDYHSEAKELWVHQPKWGNCKADLFIHPPNLIPLVPAPPVGVDFEHVMRRGDATRVKSERIDEMASALTRGTIKEFHLVTNEVFSEQDKNKIETANSRLRESGHGLIYYHEKLCYDPQHPGALV